MSANHSGCAVILLFVLSMACPFTLQAGDIMPPTIVHTPLERFPSGMPLRIQARVTDETGVREVVLFYRSAGEGQYRRLPMTNMANSSLYAATLPNDVGPRIEYYIQAADTAGNAVLGKLFDPYVVVVEPNSYGVSGQTDAAASPSPRPASQSAVTQTASGERRGISRWVWVGVGVVALAAIAGAGGGGDHDAGGSPAPAPGGTGSVTINAPVP